MACTLSFTLLVTLIAVAASAPFPGANQGMGIVPQSNYEQYMPKQQVKYANYALKSAGGGYFGGFGSGGKSGSAGSSSGSGMGNYKKYLPRLEQKFMEKFAGGFAGSGSK